MRGTNALEAARDTELRRPLTQTEEMRRRTGISHEQIAHDRLWNKRPDGIAFKMPTKTKAGVICLLEFKRMSDVTSHYIVRAKRVAEAQYASLRSALAITMQRQGWKVEQVSFIAGARSLNEKELKKNLTFDEYENILKGMYSILSTLLQPGSLTKLGNARRERKGRGIINICFRICSEDFIVSELGPH